MKERATMWYKVKEWIDKRNLGVPFDNYSGKKPGNHFGETKLHPFLGTSTTGD